MKLFCSGMLKLLSVRLKKCNYYNNELIHKGVKCTKDRAETNPLINLAATHTQHTLTHTQL